MPRHSGRAHDELRPVSITRRYTKYAEGLALVCFGATHVLCPASIQERVPAFLRGQQPGRITAEYGTLPRAPGDRRTGQPAGGDPGARNHGT